MSWTRTDQQGPDFPEPAHGPAGESDERALTHAELVRFVREVDSKLEVLRDRLRARGPTLGLLHAVWSTPALPRPDPRRTSAP